MIHLHWTGNGKASYIIRYFTATIVFSCELGIYLVFHSLIDMNLLSFRQPQDSFGPGRGFGRGMGGRMMPGRGFGNVIFSLSKWNFELIAFHCGFGLVSFFQYKKLWF